MTSIGSSIVKIDGLTLTKLSQICDDRGAVLHMIRNDAEGFENFGECYFSEVLPGVIKGWKRHLVQTQNLAVPVGRIKIVIYDDRQNSRTKGRVQELELGRPDAYLRLQISPGLWYGFQCLGDTSALLANCVDLPHDPTESDLRPIDDSEIPYSWHK
jgi:dTDP-4-dehydrorhamnose 3,5-epimerase